MITIESKAAEVRVMVTAAGRENLLFRMLLRQTIPLLRNPDSVSTTERMALLQTVRYALEEAFDGEDEPGGPEEP